MPRETDYARLEGKIILTTDMAVCVELAYGDRIWVPRSCCEAGGSLDEDDVDPEVAEWWLEKERLL